MRHRKQNKKLGRSPQHRKALLASLVCGLIEQRLIRTTLSKAKLAQRYAEKMVTLARKGTLAARRQAIAELRDAAKVSALFSDIVPALSDRKGGFTRIVRLGFRRDDGAPTALLEWVGIAPINRKKKKKKEEAEKKPEQK